MSNERLKDLNYTFLKLSWSFAIIERETQIFELPIRGVENKIFSVFWMDPDLVKAVLQI